MFKLIILVTLLANLNYILTVPTSEDNVYTENESSVSNQSSSSHDSSSSSSSSTHSSSVSNSDNENECEDENEEGTTTPEQPTTTPEQPTTTPEQPNTTPTTGPSSSAIEKFYKGNSKFTANFFNNVVKENPGKSVTMSPFSTLFLLALLAYFSEGVTQEQLKKALNFENINEIPTTIPVILDSIKEQKNTTFTTAAKVYGNERSQFNDNFKNKSKEIIRAESVNISFKDAQKAADEINQWVAENTNDKIKDLVPASLLTPETELVLVNALYLLAEWKNKFDPEATRPSDFYTLDNKTIQVDTMNQVKYFKYAEIESLNAQALELPYVNDNLTCLVILPKDTDGAPSLVSKLVAEDALSSVRNSLEFERVAVSLPKFITTTSIDLKDILQKIGIVAMFDPEIGGLVGILSDQRKLYVSAAVQKATIEVNEEGSEAAAANAFVGVATSTMTSPPIPFNANRSFIYYLLFRGSPIFCGLYAGDE